MGRYFLVLLFMVTMFLTGFPAKREIILKDVTGDGVAEKIYLKETSHGVNTTYYRLTVLQKISNGWTNIFPTEFPRIYPFIYYYDKGKTGTMKTSVTSNDGFVVDKFEKNQLTNEILVYSPNHFIRVNEKCIYKGYYYRYQKEQKKLYLYRVNYTNQEYGHVCKDGQAIIKELNGNSKTNFEKASEIAELGIKLIKEKKFNELKNILANSDGGREIYAAVANTKPAEYWQEVIRAKLNIITAIIQEDTGNYIFHSKNTRAIIEIDKELKINSIMFDSSDINEP